MMEKIVYNYEKNHLIFSRPSALRISEEKAELFPINTSDKSSQASLTKLKLKYPLKIISYSKILNHFKGFESIFSEKERF